MGAERWKIMRIVANERGEVSTSPPVRRALGLGEGPLELMDVVPELVGREPELEALVRGDGASFEIPRVERVTRRVGRCFIDVHISAGAKPGELLIELVDVSDHVRDLEERAQACVNLLGERKRLEGELERLRAIGTHWAAAALEDSLTGLPNRRAAEQAIAAEISRAASGAGGTLLFLDLDRFKVFNDRYGHPAGDERLTLLGKTLRSSVRPTDFVARWGGEEFVVLLQRQRQPTAVEIALRVRRRVALVLGRDSSERGWDRFAGSTVSIGLCALQPGMTAGEALGLADEALYAAKKLGRNRIASASERGPGNERNSS